eukprot:8954928-Pyramimonas_sp.AAC.1
MTRAVHPLRPIAPLESHQTIFPQLSHSTPRGPGGRPALPRRSAATSTARPRMAAAPGTARATSQEL